jgi:diguanylate cyclase (GGDEF)-like protein
MPPSSAQAGSAQLIAAPTIDINIARQQADTRARSPKARFQDLKYRLLNQLQTTLEMDQLLTLFFNEAHSLIGLDGLKYEHALGNHQLQLGEQETHSSAYRLIIQQSHLGEIVLSRSTRFSERELEILESLLGVLLCPLRNALSYHCAVTASMTDPLTGAGNRLALMSQLNREIHIARRYKHPMSVLMIDIDKFKIINDNHGHAAGDKVLQEMVRLIQQVNRSSDTLFRLGGEEFVVLLSNTGAGGAGIIAERLCRAIAELNICTEDGSLRITVSIGFTDYDEVDTADALLKRADKAMYAAKKWGGNQIAEL